MPEVTRVLGRLGLVARPVGQGDAGVAAQGPEARGRAQVPRHVRPEAPGDVADLDPSGPGRRRVRPEVLHHKVGVGPALGADGAAVVGRGTPEDGVGDRPDLLHETPVVGAPRRRRRVTVDTTGAHLVLLGPVRQAPVQVP